jgi:SnoaL-like domain
MSALEDKDAIRELLAEYCFLLDSQRLREFGELFTEAGLWASRNGSATGPAAIEALLRKIVSESAPELGRKHFTTNIVIRLDADSAEVISNFLVVRDSAAGPVIAVAGTYRDVVARQGAKWLFRSRELSHDIAAGSGTKPGSR